MWHRWCLVLKVMQCTQFTILPAEAVVWLKVSGDSSRRKTVGKSDGAPGDGLEELASFI